MALDNIPDIPGGGEENQGTTQVVFQPDEEPRLMDYKYGIFSKLVDNWTGGVNSDNIFAILKIADAVYEHIRKEQ